MSVATEALFGPRTDLASPALVSPVGLLHAQERCGEYLQYTTMTPPATLRSNNAKLKMFNKTSLTINKQNGL